MAENGRPVRSVVTAAQAKKITFSDGSRKKHTWTAHQRSDLTRGHLQSLYDCDLGKLKRDVDPESSILVNRHDTETIDELKLRIQLFDNGQSTPLSPPLLPNQRQPLWPSEETIWIPPGLEAQLLRDTEALYTPETVGKPCCPCRPGNCGGSNCQCREGNAECFHRWSCPNTAIRDGFFPITYVCEQTFRNPNNQAAYLTCLGVKSFENIKKGTVVEVYAGVCRMYTGGRSDGIAKSNYSIDMTDRSKWSLKPEQSVIIDPIPKGNMAMFYNTAGDGAFKRFNNTELIMYQSCNSVYPVLVANQDISKDEYLMWDYGSRYSEGTDFQVWEPLPPGPTVPLCPYDEYLDRQRMERGVLPYPGDGWQD